MAIGKPRSWKYRWAVEAVVADTRIPVVADAFRRVADALRLAADVSLVAVHTRIPAAVDIRMVVGLRLRCKLIALLRPRERFPRKYGCPMS